MPRGTLTRTVTAVSVAGDRRFAVVLLVVLVTAAGCSSPLGDGDARTTYGVPEADPATTADATTVGTPEPGTAGSAGSGPEQRAGGGGTRGSNGRAADNAPPATVPDPPDADDPEDPARRQVEVSELAPGLSADTAWGPDRLAAAHHEVLADRSFRVRYRRVVTLPGGDRRIRTVAAAVSADRRRYRVRQVVSRPADGPRGRVVTGYWSGGDGALRSITYGDTRTYGRLDAADLPAEGLPAVGDPTHRSLVRRAFGATVLTAVESVAGSVAPARYWVFASGNRADRITPGSTGVRNLSLRAQVDSRSLVRTLRVSYERRERDGWAAVRTTVAFGGVGRTDPAPPAWVDDARREDNESEPIGGVGRSGEGIDSRDPAGSVRDPRLEPDDALDLVAGFGDVAVQDVVGGVDRDLAALRDRDPEAVEVPPAELAVPDLLDAAAEEVVVDVAAVEADERLLPLLGNSALGHL
ncbi:hypothetical protein BRD00_04645 [Halobacteriales archaeon QS_8_69_26]|nr:MAG: hypothetical protein BRD00_04645 [Halobacteriales archaeon QS_8_69_26]